MAPDVGAKLIPGTVPGIKLAPTSGAISDPISEDGFFQKEGEPGMKKTMIESNTTRGVVCAHTHTGLISRLALALVLSLHMNA